MFVEFMESTLCDKVASCLSGVFKVVGHIVWLDICYSAERLIHGRVAAARPSLERSCVGCEQYERELLDAHGTTPSKVIPDH